MSKYNNEELRVGDTAIILDITNLTDPNSCGKNLDMIGKAGQKVTIVSKNNKNFFRVKENYWSWDRSWLKKV